MKMRIEGLPDEAAQLVDDLRQTPGLTIVSVSRPYANRGDDQQVRVYVEVCLAGSQGGSQ